MPYNVESPAASVKRFSHGVGNWGRILTLFLNFGFGRKHPFGKNRVKMHPALRNHRFQVAPSGLGVFALIWLALQFRIPSEFLGDVHFVITLMLNAPL